MYRSPAAAAAAMREAYVNRARRVVSALSGLPGVACRMPQAGMFVVADIRGTGLSGTAFANRLLDEAGVAVMPGESFGDAFNGWIRLSLTAPDDAIDRALDRVVAFAGRLAPRKSA